LGRRKSANHKGNRAGSFRHAPSLRSPGPGRSPTPEDPAESDDPAAVTIAALGADQDSIDAALEAQTDEEAVRRLQTLIESAGNGSETTAKNGPARGEGSAGEDGGGRPLPAQKAGGDIFGGSDRTGLNTRNAEVARKLGEVPGRPGCL
jgi:hypothetical protein